MTAVRVVDDADGVRYVAVADVTTILTTIADTFECEMLPFLPVMVPSERIAAAYRAATAAFATLA